MQAPLARGAQAPPQHSPAHGAAAPDAGSAGTRQSATTAMKRPIAYVVKGVTWQAIATGMPSGLPEDAPPPHSPTSSGSTTVRLSDELLSAPYTSIWSIATSRRGSSAVK